MDRGNAAAAADTVPGVRDTVLRPPPPPPFRPSVHRVAVVEVHQVVVLNRVACHDHRVARCMDDGEVAWQTDPLGVRYPAVTSPSAADSAVDHSCRPVDDVAADDDAAAAGGDVAVSAAVAVHHFRPFLPSRCHSASILNPTLQTQDSHISTLSSWDERENAESFHTFDVILFLKWA